MTMDGRAQPAWYADRASPRPPARTAATNVVGDGLRGGSGFLAGLIGGAIGGAFAIAIAKTDTVLTADTNVTYLAISARTEQCSARYYWPPTRPGESRGPSSVGSSAERYSAVGWEASDPWPSSVRSSNRC